MRTELLIIVAIIFLCSWCVYILVKMNGSVENSFQTPKNQLATDRAIGSDFGFDTSKSIHHGTSLDPPYRLYSNITENPYNYSNVNSLNSSPINNTSANIEDEYYEEDYPISLVQNNQNNSNHNPSRIKEKHDDHLNHLPGLLESNLVDIDVTRPTANKDNHHRSELQSKHYQKKDVSRKKKAAASTIDDSRSPYLRQPIMNGEYIGSQTSASNQLRSFNDPTNYKKAHDNDANQVDDDAKNGDDDSGTEIDERSGGTSYNEHENVAHDKGHRYSLSPDSNYRNVGKTTDSIDDIPDKADSKIDSDEYEYEDDPVVAATSESGVNPIDKDTHEHKMKESVVSQRWDDGVNNENDHFKGDKPDGEKKNAEDASDHDNEDDTVRFLDLDKRRTAFSEKRFKRHINDNQKYELEGSNYESESVPEASINSIYSPAIKVQLPDLANTNMSISATLNPFQTAHINLLPGSTEQTQYTGYPERRRKRIRRRKKRKFDKNNPPNSMALIPVENHQTGIQPEYIVEGQDRATQPSRHHSKNKKNYGHKSKKSSSSGKHSKLQTSQKKKISKSFKKGNHSMLFPDKTRRAILFLSSTLTHLFTCLL